MTAKTWTKFVIGRTDANPQGLNQLLETIAALICDRLQVRSCFIAVLRGENVDYIVLTGDKHILPDADDLGMLKALSLQKIEENWLLHDEHIYLIPLWFILENNASASFCGFPRLGDSEVDNEARKDVDWLLA